MAEKISPAKLARGKKWAGVRRRNIILGEEEPQFLKDNEWMDSQASIVEDEKAYADSLKPVKPEKPDKPEKPEEKKKLNLKRKNKWVSET